MLQPATAPRRRQLDEFGELTDLKRTARRRAERLGHYIGVFTLRPQDATKANGWCAHCGKCAVVNTAIDALPPVYGHALEERCPGPRRG